MTFFVICVGSSLLSKATDVTLSRDFFHDVTWVRVRKRFPAITWGAT